MNGYIILLTVAVAFAAGWFLGQWRFQKSMEIPTSEWDLDRPPQIGITDEAIKSVQDLLNKADARLGPSLLTIGWGSIKTGWRFESHWIVSAIPRTKVAPEIYGKVMVGPIEFRIVKSYWKAIDGKTVTIVKNNLTVK
jgi:hypothetical protein